MAVVKPEIKTTEYEMFSRYRETGDIALRDEIVSSYIYIAEILSRKFINAVLNMTIYFKLHVWEFYMRLSVLTLTKALNSPHMQPLR